MRTTLIIPVVITALTLNAVLLATRAEKQQKLLRNFDHEIIIDVPIRDRAGSEYANKLSTPDAIPLLCRVIDA